MLIAGYVLEIPHFFWDETQFIMAILATKLPRHHHGLPQTNATVDVDGIKVDISN
jgi:hypothetical protein